MYRNLQWDKGNADDKADGKIEVFSDGCIGNCDKINEILDDKLEVLIIASGWAVSGPGTGCI